MVNQFRTLLCNLSYQASSPQDHLTKGFNGLVLPDALLQFRRLLFPDGTSRDDILFDTHNLVNAVYTTTFRGEIVKYDKRITYQSDAEGLYFSATRTSQPLSSNALFPLFASGDYTPENNTYTEDIRVTQIDDSLAVRIYSGVSGRVFTPSLTLNFDEDNLSQNIPVTGTGMTLRIAGTSESFTSSAGKTWQLYADAPRKFDMMAVYNIIKASPTIVENMLACPSVENTASYEYEWKNNNNFVYKLAAILICYVMRVNTLLNT